MGDITNLFGPAPARPAPHRGFFGSVKHLVGQTGADLYHTAVNAPAGTWEVAKTAEQAEQARVEYLLGTASKEEVQRKVAKANELGNAIVESTKHTATHPGEHPGNFALLALPVASGAARAGEAAAMLRNGVPAATVAKALASGTGPTTRTLRVNGLTVEAPASRSALGRTGQKAIDVSLQAAAQRKPGGLGSAMLADRAGKHVEQAGKVREALWRSDAAVLAKMGRKLTPGEQKALQVVAEQAPLHGRVLATLERIANTTGKEQARHGDELKLLREAEPHLVKDGGTPALVNPKLQAVYRKMEQVAGGRESLAKRLGMLSEEAAQGRKTKAGRSALRQPLDEAALGGQMSLLGTPVNLFEAGANAIRIPDVARSRIGRQQAVKGNVVGSPQAPGSLTHEYTGELRNQGLRRQDTTRLVAESSAELARFAALEHVVSLAKQAATATPTRPSDLAIRLDGLEGKLPLEVQKFMDDPEGTLAGLEPGEKANLFNQIRERLIFDRDRKGSMRLAPERAAEFAKLYADDKIGFVPRGLLGEFAKPQGSIQSTFGKGAVNFWDGVNNAQRFQILYLKLAYAIPNLLGNTALNILQQGFAAPLNLARAVRMNATLGPEATARYDALVGEGVARAISAHGVGPLSALVDKAAGIWSVVVDRYARRAAILHEAARAGYRSKAQLRALVMDAKHEDDLVRVTGEANREIIDYGAMSAREREVVRRVIFFYPWVRGSTVYAGRLLREHPAKAADIGVLGQEGQDWTSRILGKIPSYLEGLIPVGSDKVSNPAAATILGTPAQVGLGIAGLATGNIPQTADAGSFLVPALNLALAEAFRHNYAQGYGYPGGTNAGKIALDVLESNTPQVSLYRNIEQARHGEGKDRLYPPSVLGALMKFGVGGIYPQKYDKVRLHAMYLKEQQQMRRGG